MTTKIRFGDTVKFTSKFCESADSTGEGELREKLGVVQLVQTTGGIKLVTVQWYTGEEPLQMINAYNLRVIRPA